MPRSTRRDALKQLGSAGLGFAVAPSVLRGQRRIAGQKGARTVTFEGQPIEMRL